MVKENQVSRLAEYMGQYPYVTQLVARQVLGIERLASRIHDLKRAGFDVRKEYRKDFSGKRYVRYFLNSNL